MNRPENIQQQLSAYVDGQLSNEEARQVEQAVGADESLRTTWPRSAPRRTFLRAEQALEPPAGLVHRVLAEARRRNLIPAPQPAAQAAGAGRRAGGEPARPQTMAGLLALRLAAAASLVLAVAAGAPWPCCTGPTSPPPPRRPVRRPTPEKRPRPPSPNVEARPPIGKLAFKEDRFRKGEEDWAYGQKNAARRQLSAKLAPEPPAAARLRSSLAEGKEGLQHKDADGDDLYHASAKAIVRDLAEESRASGPTARRGAAAKNGPDDELGNIEEQASGEAVQKLDLHVTHLAAARREVAAILAAAASPDATGERAKAKSSAGNVNVTLARDVSAEKPAGAARPGAATHIAGGRCPRHGGPGRRGDPGLRPLRRRRRGRTHGRTGRHASGRGRRPRAPRIAARRPPARTGNRRDERNLLRDGGKAGKGIELGAGAGGTATAPTSAAASLAGTALAAVTDRTEAPVAADRLGQTEWAGLAGKFQPATSTAQRASALASLRGMACDGSAGTGVWKFVIVDTPERIERISQAVRRVGVPDKDAESGQRLCLAEQIKGAGQTQFAGRISQSEATSQSQSQARFAPYRVAEIQRRPEPRPAEPLRLLIITLRAEPAAPTSNANPDRNLSK